MTGIRDRRVPGRVRLLLVALLVLHLPLVGCGDREPTGRDTALTPAEFIEIIVALREAERELEEADPDSAAKEFARRRTEILDDYGATEDNVRAFIELNHGRPGLMSIVWDSIAQRLRTDSGGDTLRDPFQPEGAW
jgi:hypothetical protein